VSAGLDTVAIRSPAHPVARALIERARVPIAAPSANRAGRLSPTTAEACSEELGVRIPTILDGGACPVGVESTIIGFEDGSPVLLRSGAIPRADLEAVTGRLGGPQRRAISAPGMMTTHYAPRATLRLNATQVRDEEALLAFGPHALSGSRHATNLSPTGDLREAAANLFAMLRFLDGSGARVIAVMPIPDCGLGEAINDRLSRAAAPRELQ
jgi:L-threonylcarbamoyladenylate synthase